MTSPHEIQQPEEEQGEDSSLLMLVCLISFCASLRLVWVGREADRKISGPLTLFLSHQHRVFKNFRGFFGGGK